jgi:hypothetical protein
MANTRPLFDPVVDGGRICARCKLVRPTEDFGVDNRYADRYSRECRQCGRDRDQERAAADPMYRRRYHLKRRYGMTLEDYDAMLKRQGGGCAVCHATPGGRVLHVDHDHSCCPMDADKTCGQCIRGLLCDDCNRGLGSFQDNPDLLMAAAAYLLSVTGR